MSLGLPPLDGRLELRGLLGEGGMGQVHRAWDQTLERAVAVKFVRGGDPQEAERLLLEARLQARVEHPNVVRVHEVGTLEGRPCIVMQLVEGGTLASLSQETDLPSRITLLREAALGLHAAHLQGLIHRDVKPGNVLVESPDDGAPRALVSDFGLAKDEEGGLTRSGLPAGTLDFMAPEVLLGAGPVDFRVDVYSLGATAYSLLSGRLPFRHTTARPQAPASDTPTGQDDSAHLLRRLLEEDPEPLVGIPSDLATIIAKAMEKAPADRYASAEALANDLGRFQDGVPILARRSTMLERLLKWSRRNPTAARASVAAMLAVFLGLGYGFWTTRQAARQSLEAARLGALAESLEAQFRMENLAPAHNVSAVLGQVRADAERLRPRAAWSGPAAFALGRALELLNDWPGSRAAFQQAWDGGYRSPQTAEALGLAIIRVYDQELRRARSSLAPGALKAREARLDQSLREPARALLAQGDPRGWRRIWAESLLDILRGDFEAARQHARSLHERDPQRYEALTLEGEAWLAEAVRRREEGRFAEAAAGLDQAVTFFERSLAWGRSDIQPHSDMAAVCTERMRLAHGLGADSATWFRVAGDWLDKALRLSPEHPDLLLGKAFSLLEMAEGRVESDWKQKVAWVGEGIACLERAERQRPDSLPILLAKADMLGSSARFKGPLGESTQPDAEQAMQILPRLQAMAPEDPKVHLVAMYVQYEYAKMLNQQGREAQPAVQAALDSADRTLRLDPSRPITVLSWKGMILSGLGGQVWRHGGDPRPVFAQVVENAEAQLKVAPDQVASRHTAALALLGAANQETDFGGEVEATLKRAVEILDEGLHAHPDHEPFLMAKGQVRLAEAYWRSLRGEDPAPAAPESRRLLLRAGQLNRGALPIVELLAGVDLIQASWELHCGRSPEVFLGHAEERLARLFRTPDYPSSGTYQFAAWGAQLRGQWARARHSSHVSHARKAQEAIAQAIRLDSGDPALLVVQARIQILAGDQPGALASLAKARALNPLIERGPDYQRVTREASGS